MEHNREICVVVGGPQKRWQWVVDYINKNTSAKVRVRDQDHFSLSHKIRNSYVLILKDLINHSFKNEIVKSTDNKCVLVYSDRTRPELIKAFEIMGVDSTSLINMHPKENVVDKMSKVNSIVFGSDINELVRIINNGMSWSQLHTKLILERKVNIEHTPFVEQVMECAKANCLSVSKNPPNRSHPRVKIDPKFYPNLVPQILQVRANNSWIDTFRILYESGLLHSDITLSGFTQGARVAIAKFEKSMGEPGEPGEPVKPVTSAVVQERKYSAAEYDEVFSKWHEGEEALKVANAKLEEKASELCQLEDKLAAAHVDLGMLQTVVNNLSTKSASTGHDPIFLRMLAALEASCTERGPFHALCKIILEG